jgi:hypothetical protein
VRGIDDGELAQVESNAIRTGERVLVELTPEGRSAYGIAP